MANFKSNGEILSQGIEAIFPIIRIIDGRVYKFEATAFFISTNGMFCTAKHNLYRRGNGLMENDLYGVFFYDGNKYNFRKIISVVDNSRSDICIGMLEPINDEQGSIIKNKVMNLSRKTIKIGDTLATYAYPNSEVVVEEKLTKLNFVTTWYFGEVTEEYLNGRDSVLMPGLCYEATIKILQGASGGPVGNSDGHVCGVNSTGYDTFDVSYITPISEIFNMKVVIESVPYTIMDLADLNLISII